MNFKTPLGRLTAIALSASVSASLVSGSVLSADTSGFSNPIGQTAQLTAVNQVIQNISASVNNVIAPKAGLAVQNVVPAGTGYTAAISWTPSGVVYDYNTAYTAVLTLTPASGYEFGSVSAAGWTAVNNGGILKLTKTYPATALKKLMSITAPADNVVLAEYKATAASVIAALPTTVKANLEANSTADLAAEWSCNGYNANPGARNTFVWSVPESALTGKVDRNNIALSGSITVINAAAIPVANTMENAAITYNGAAYNVAEMFTKDVNAGAASYAITGGTGEATLSGSEITITKAGTFDIKLTTAPNGAYGAGEASATLTVAKAAGEGSVTAPDFTYGDTSQMPVPSSPTNGAGNVTYMYKLKNADDSTYSAIVPTDIGSYTVKAVFAATDLYEEATATDDFNISAAVPVVSEKPAVKRLKKRSTLSKTVITEGEIKGADNELLTGTYTWNEPDKVMLTDGTEKLTFTPDNANYNPIEIEVEVDVYSAYDNSTLSSTTANYTVTFASNGGSSISSQKVALNKKATEPGEPAREGYIFEGWYTDRNLTKEYSFNTKVTKNFTLYAKWSEIEEEPVEPEEEIVEDEAAEADECDGTASNGCLLTGFYDLNSGEWYHESVEFVLGNGIMNGTETGLFEPEGELTRAMLVTVLYRVENEPKISAYSNFTDVSADSYYAKAVAWAQANSIVNGNTEFEFAPEDSITREQFAAIMYRYAIYKGYDVAVGDNSNLLSYDDVHEISNYAISAFQYVTGSGLMQGKTRSTLNPRDNATRAEAAAILCRFIEANS